MSISHPFQPLRVDSGFVFIDDDLDFLESLKLVLPRYSSAVRYFDHTSQLDPILNHNASLLENERAALHAIAVAQDPDQEGNVPLLALKYFASQWRREIIGVLVADYDMPFETGDLLCERHATIGLQRVLLTGKADEAQAITAFNFRRIDHFLGKNASESELDAHGDIKLDRYGRPTSMPLLTILRRVLDSQRELSAQKRGQPLLPVLNRRASEILQMPAAAEGLAKFLSEYRIREYMMLGFPQGILGLSLDKKVYWIQLETAESQVSQLEQLEGSLWPNDVVERVRLGATALNSSWMGELDLDATEVPLRVLSQTPYLAVGLTVLDNLPLECQPLFW